MMDDIITLCAERTVQDEYGRFVKKQPERIEVMAKVLSITRSEFFQAGRSGLEPAYRFDVFFGDYNGEGVVEYKGETYSIYRTFHPANSDYIELYAERKGGTDGKGDTDR